MVQAGGHRRPWAEAASSAFAVASALPSSMNSEQIADLFEKTGETFLIAAARTNNVHAVKNLAADPDLLDETDNEGWSALLNASHKGHVDVVRILLEAGASVDLPDMMGWSPLMWAVYKCHPEIVDMLLNYGAHVNLIDEEDGLTPLIVASGRGFTSVVEKLLAADAQVNACDKFGSTALIWAARKGHLPIVQMLLNAGAEVDAVGMGSSTALMLATKGNYLTVVDLLLTREPNVNVVDQNGLSALGIAAREGYADICESLINSGAFVNQSDKYGNWILISAVRSGNANIVRLLLEKFADVNARDSENRTALHLAIDKSFMDIVYIILERKPNLELKNRDGETPLLRAVKSRHVALCDLLVKSGAKISAADNNGDNALHLALRARSRRLTQTLLANPSDSRLLYRPNRLGQTPYSIDNANPQPILPLIFGPIDAEQHMDTMLGYDVYSNVLADIGFLYYGSEMRGWSAPGRVANSLSRFIYRIRLLWNVATLYAPMHSENDIASNPVSFLFADYHRLSSIGGEQALAKIVATLFESAETHFGVLPVRLFCSLRTAYPGQYGSLRRHCGVPVVLLVGVAVCMLLSAEVFMIIWLFSDRDTSSGALLVASIAFMVVFLMLTIYPIIILLRYGYTNVPRKHVNEAARSVHKLRFEGLMQKLQTEVDILADMIRSLDAFTRSQTRLVVVVDGLDNCEQERMVQTLDALELLFSARKHRPFITIIAVDPHIIVSAINHNMHSALTGTELTGHDYLKNIVNMPLYLHNSALRQLQNKLKDKRESLADWKERYRRQDTFHGSHLSLADGRQSRKATIVVGTRSIGESLLSDDYFSNMNPRAMRRIVNALTLTGRLMRAFEIDFSWLSLGHWVSLLEQWPSRMCWLIDRAVDINNNGLTLAEVYHQLKDHIPKKDSLIELDRNPDNFEAFLDSPTIPSAEQLTVGHVKKFVPCTSNLDPYLRKLIRERRQGLEDPVQELGFGSVVIPPNAKYLFGDEKVWSTVCTPLVEMRLDDVCALLKKLDIASNRLDAIVRKFEQLNLGGLVLASCSLQDLKDALGIPLGDWTMVRLLVETLKAFGSNVPGVKTDKRRALTLPEEDEEGSEESVDLTTRRGTIVQSPSAMITAEERRRSMAMPEEINTDHKWLMESLSGMDLTQPEGDLNLAPSSAASVRFDDAAEDGLASDADSTESRFGSRENLLDPGPILSRHSSSTGRGDLMRQIHNDSIHSTEGVISARSSVVSDDDHQVTIMRRDGSIVSGERPQLTNIFGRENGNARRIKCGHSAMMPINAVATLYWSVSE
ncbi:putative septum site-determining protein MinC [Necator americanus]|uniref:Putative septum site-determining protein MinC n=1 Tax=Necator americanus TaxID=51031 RepID=W2T2G0_NECAM|nr:putative septum site-determining protein MinC [Necator americanus]ETN76088.1 putative septum site-determining protein MinC [Necator americanus]